MSTYGQMQADLQLLGMASLLNADFGSLLNKCQREEVESYPWSFIFKEVVISGVPQVNTGIATVAQGSNVVSFQGGFNPLTLGVQPGWFIWLGPTQTTPYIISSVTSTNVVLSTLFQLPSQSILCIMQPLYYPVFPLTSVQRVRQIDELAETSRAELDQIDPSRIATGGDPAIRWANAPFVSQVQSFAIATITLQGGNAIVNLASPSNAIAVGDAVTIVANTTSVFNGNKSVIQIFSPTQVEIAGPFNTHTPNGTGGILTDLDITQNMFQIELWPRPTTQLPYIADGKIGAIDMVNDTDIPQIPSQVLEAKAMMYAARAVFASSGNPKWLQISEAYRQDYLVELEKAKTEDTKRVVPKGITSWGGRRLFDAAIDFNHDLDGPPDYSTS